MKLTINNKHINRDCELSVDSNKSLEISGLRDSHCHLMWLGMQENGLKLDSCKSYEELIQLSQNYQKINKSTWLTGRGWNNENWENKSLPDNELLNKYFPDIPVLLKRIDGHAAIANDLALEKAKIYNSTKDPAGGKIQRDKQGNATGLLVDNAIELIEAIIPRPSDDEFINHLLTAQDKCLELGLLEVHDMDVHLDWLPYFNHLANENLLKLKVKSYIRGFDGEFLSKCNKPYIINNLDVAGLKFFSDGALGSRGAALIEDYSDEPNNKGLYLLEKDSFFDLSLKGANLGFEISTHAIGDAANRFTLDNYELLRNNGVKVPLRIEHCQMVHPIDLQRFKELNIHAAIQPIHCISDKDMAYNRIGERVNYSYPWKTLLNLGIEISGGSDFPIESPDPILGINAFIQNDITWQQSEIIDLENALNIYGVIK